MWQQYEEAYLEDVATGELAMAVRNEQRKNWAKYAAKPRDLDLRSGPELDVVHLREEVRALLREATKSATPTASKAP